MRKTLPFKKGPLTFQNRSQGRGQYYYTAKSSYQDQIKNVQLQNNASASPERSIMLVQHQKANTSFTIQKEVPVTSNSELVLPIKITTLDHVHPIIIKLFTKGIPSVPLERGLPYFITGWEKLFRIKKYYLL